MIGRYLTAKFSCRGNVTIAAEGRGHDSHASCNATLDCGRYDAGLLLVRRWTGRCRRLLRLALVATLLSVCAFGIGASHAVLLLATLLEIVIRSSGHPVETPLRRPTEGERARDLARPYSGTYSQSAGQRACRWLTPEVKLRAPNQRGSRYRPNN